MNLWLRYLKAHITPIAAFLAFSLIFAVSFALYRLPVEAVLYAAAVCAFVGLVLLTRCYLLFYEKHKRLQALLTEAAVTIEHLPPARSPLEEDYQALIRMLHEEKIQLADRMQGRYTDLAEYYTVWAHQIKTPISAMYLNLQHEDSALSRELTQDLQQIERYVEMALCYLRLDADSTDYLIREYELDAIVKQAARKFAAQFIRRKIQLNYTPIAYRVLTDEKWLLFVLEQLLSNALKYTHSGGTITIAMAEPGKLYIRDTGIGIAPEDLPRIFEKGYTGYNGRSDKKASGLGLHLCRRICANLGHAISAESTPGQGTTIHLDLQRAKLETE